MNGRKTATDLGVSGDDHIFLDRSPEFLNRHFPVGGSCCELEGMQTAFQPAQGTAELESRAQRVLTLGKRRSHVGAGEPMMRLALGHAIDANSDLDNFGRRQRPAFDRQHAEDDPRHRPIDHSRRVNLQTESTICSIRRSVGCTGLRNTRDLDGSNLAVLIVKTVDGRRRHLMQAADRLCARSREVEAGIASHRDASVHLRHVLPRQRQFRLTHKQPVQPHLDPGDAHWAQCPAGNGKLSVLGE